MPDEATSCTQHATRRGPRQPVLQRKFHVSGRNADQLETRIAAFAAALQARGGNILHVKRRTSADTLTCLATICYTVPARALQRAASAGQTRGAA